MNGERDRKWDGGGGAHILRCKKYAAENARGTDGPRASGQERVIWLLVAAAAAPLRWLSGRTMGEGRIPVRADGRRRQGGKGFVASRRSRGLNPIILPDVAAAAAALNLLAARGLIMI